MDEIFENSQKQDIILENIRQNSLELLSTLTKRNLHIRDFACLAAEGNDTGSITALPEGINETFNIFKEYTEGVYEDSPKGEDIYDKGCFELLDTLSAANLCRHIASEIDAPSVLESVKPESARICYFRNHFSDQAFLRFSSLLPDASADYTHDYASACEGVYYGKYDYCILPADSYSDGQMTRFIALMQKYELNIALSCKIQTADDEFICFYLLSGNATCFQGSDRLAITVIPGSGYPLWKFICSAELLGAKCTECTSLPQRLYSEKAYFATFDISDADANALSVYLQLALPAYNLGGVYREIK